MKISSATLTNLKSYAAPCRFDFMDGINILVGPNGGGKTNALLAICSAISEFIIPQYEMRQETNHLQFQITRHERVARNLEPYSGSTSGSLIEFEILLEQSDLHRIESAASSLTAIESVLKERNAKIPTPLKLQELNTLRPSQRLKYSIQNNRLSTPEPLSAEGIFLSFMKNVPIFSWAARQTTTIPIQLPILFLFDRARSVSVAAEVDRQSDVHYFNATQHFYSGLIGGSIGMSDMAVRHFLLIYRKCNKIAARTHGVVETELFEQHRDVSTMKRYMSRLGYEWQFAPSENDEFLYQMTFSKAGRILRADRLSSGEIEILNLVCAVLALNVRGGVIIIDEPELHLHPRWQLLLLNLLNEIAEEFHNQIILCTHSAALITAANIRNIIRVYQENGSSTNVSLAKAELPGLRHLYAMINSHNNERVFFADAVVLVEGITDRIALKSLIDLELKRRGKIAAVEVVEVGGKKNFAAYRKLAEALRMPCFVVADLDYVLDLAADTLGSIFEASEKKLYRKVIRDKRSRDRVGLLQAIEESLETGNTNVLREYALYLKARSTRLRKNLTISEAKELLRFLKGQRLMGVFILKRGEIEDYFAVGCRTLDQIVEASVDGDLVPVLASPCHRRELSTISEQIVSKCIS